VRSRRHPAAVSLPAVHGYWALQASATMASAELVVKGKIDHHSNPWTAARYATPLSIGRPPLVSADAAESGDLELLMRNKPMQSRYDEWMAGMKAEYGSTGASASCNPLLTSPR